MKIYLASMYARREELLSHKRELEEFGHEITARWLLGGHEAKPTDSSTTWASFAVDDLLDVQYAEVLVEFTEQMFARDDTLTGDEANLLKRGGRHVEFGYAYALNKTLVLVGPRENVFHNLESVFQFNTWPEARAFLNGMEVARVA